MQNCRTDLNQRDSSFSTDSVVSIAPHVLLARKYHWSCHSSAHVFDFCLLIFIFYEGCLKNFREIGERERSNFWTCILSLLGSFITYEEVLKGMSKNGLIRRDQNRGSSLESSAMLRFRDGQNPRYTPRDNPPHCTVRF